MSFVIMTIILLSILQARSYRKYCIPGLHLSETCIDFLMSLLKDRRALRFQHRVKLSLYYLIIFNFSLAEYLLLTIEKLPSRVDSFII